MAAGLKTLELVSEPDFYRHLRDKTEHFVLAMQERAKHAGIALSVNYVGGMFGLFFSAEEKISRFSQVMQCDQALFKRFFHAMLAEGVYLAPSAFEAGFVSAAHTDEDLTHTLDAASRVFSCL
jgi:glutamate-1-semialdehyde 2,1-aminomutase